MTLITRILNMNKSVDEILTEGGLGVWFSHMSRFPIGDLKAFVLDAVDKELRINYPDCPYQGGVWLARKVGGKTSVWEDIWKDATPEEELLVKAICFPYVW